MTDAPEVGARNLAPVYGAGFWSVCHWPWTRLPMSGLRWSPRSEDPKLIIRVITFELTQQRPRTDGRADRRTDGGLTVAMCAETVTVRIPLRRDCRSASP